MYACIPKAEYKLRALIYGGRRRAAAAARRVTAHANYTWICFMCVTV